MSSIKEIILDPSIRDWVLLPIFVVMFLQGILRQYVSVLLKDEKKLNVEAIASNQLLKRSQRLRMNAMFLPAHSFHMRKFYLMDKALAEHIKPADAAGEEGKAAAAPAQDPLAMVGMMKQNMAMIIPNMLMMGWVSYFFSGFVLVKLPFGLSDRFKAMLQRGIQLSSLDVSYVSSLSWYFVNVFGLRGLFSVVLGSDSSAIDNAEAMAAQMQGGMGGPMGAPVDTAKIMETEKNELDITQYFNGIQQAEHNLLLLPITP